MSFPNSRRERPDPSTLDLADGTVTRVAQQAKDPERASVFIDDAFAFGVSIALAVEAGLKKGMVLTADQQRALLVQQEAHAARASALRSLDARARTSGEIRRLLTDKGFDADVAEDTVHALVEAGLLDDAAYARQYARSRFQASGHGPSRIRQDLQRRGVDRAVIDAALDELAETEDVGDRAEADAATRWRALAAEPDLRKRKKKTLDFLLRRGFSFDDARRAVDAAADAEPDADDARWDD